MSRNLKIYFGGSIKGGRSKVEDYKKIVDYLKTIGTVLDEHVADPNLQSSGESITSTEIYNRDVSWINECDILIAEVTVPSLGVGYEIGYAESLNKRIICLYQNDESISAMIKGNNSITHISYDDVDELLTKLSTYFN
ncbi:nucleoside 2-deoxyribosyltransferase [Firmicutes bacterium CAG:582]|nr:nucleoside 2-deoxyribosyltransferase [bacterium]CDB28968.1 nucleoside 2-deoxyribosyltransferase [Firmicutes bacterium CAG:582]